MPIHLVLIMTGLIALAPTTAIASTTKTSTTKASQAKVADTVKANKLRCSYVISKAKKKLVRLELPTPHPKKFAIMAPGGQWYYLQDPPQAAMFGTAKEFAKAKKLEFDVETFKAKEGASSKAQKVFRQPGKYMFYFANNIETEPANTFSMSCQLPINVASAGRSAQGL